MPTPIEICLSSLLPTVSYLPPDLIALSTSLLAQSRTKASSLKAEEEIARTYACCHIACQRLGHRLGLEIGKPAPPVKPRVYDRLKEYLNAVLKTPQTKRTADQSNPARTTTATPTRDRPPPADITPASRKRAAPEQEPEQEPESDVQTANIPAHIKPLIRVVCNSAREPRAIPHVFAGLSSILHHLSTMPSAAKRRKPTSVAEPPTRISDAQLPNLVIALFVVVYNRFYDEEKVVDAPLEAAAIKALREEGGVVGRVGAEQRRLDEIHWFKEAVWTAWKDMEWIDNIPTPEDGFLPPEEGEAEAGMVEEEGGDGEEGLPAKPPLRRQEKHARRDTGEVGAAGLLPGLGTMFQPAVNWLSEERCEDFERWKRQVLKETRVAS